MGGSNLTAVNRVVSQTSAVELISQAAYHLLSRRPGERFASQSRLTICLGAPVAQITFTVAVPFDGRIYFLQRRYHY